MKKLFGICGPTASGKTEAALRICERLGGEVVSADSMQLYEGMDILSAKPSPEELKRVRHHLIGIAGLNEKFNASRYKELAGQAVEDIFSRGCLPLLCGGTGMYIDALTRGIRMSEQADEGLRAELKAEASVPGGMERLHDRLKTLDPVAAAKYPAQDTRRVIRSLEIYLLTGRTRTEIEREDAQIADDYEAHLYALDWDRQELYSRIDRRVDFMVEHGLIDEVAAIMRENADIQETAAQAIGFKEIRSALLNEIPMELAIENVKTATRHLAKRQLTWFKRDRRVTWVRPERADDIVYEIQRELGL